MTQNYKHSELDYYMVIYPYMKMTYHMEDNIDYHDIHTTQYSFIPLSPM